MLYKRYVVKYKVCAEQFNSDDIAYMRGVGFVRSLFFFSVDLNYIADDIRKTAKREWHKKGLKYKSSSLYIEEFEIERIK